MSSSKAQCWCLWRAHNLFGKEKFDIVSTINQNYTTGLLIHRSISPSCHLSSHCRFKDDQKCYLLLKVLKSQGRFSVKVRGLDTRRLNWVCCCSSVEDVNWPLKLGMAGHVSSQIRIKIPSHHVANDYGGQFVLGHLCLRSWREKE